MHRSWLLLLGLTLGCVEETKGDEDTGGTQTVDPSTTTPTGTTVTTPTDTVTEPCVAQVASVDPGNNTEATVDTTVVATFTEPVPAPEDVTITLTDPAGAAVAGSLDLAADGLSASFTPDAPLAYDTAYAVEVSACEDGIVGAFRTLPAPIDPLLLPGRTYGLLYDDLVFTQPGDTTLLTLDVDYILVQVRDVDLVAETIDAIATTAYDQAGYVDPDCPAVVETPPSDFSTNPRFSVGPADIEVAFNTDTVTLEQFSLIAEFDPTADAIVNVKLDALFDPSQILAGVDCSFVAAIVSGTCVACPSGAGDCLVLEADAASAAWLPAVDVVATCGL